MKKDLKILLAGISMLIAFAIWTLLVKYVDVAVIGPNGSAVGFAKLNSAVHQFTGVNMMLYDITDWLSIIPIGFVTAFALIGLIQLIKRKRILMVDGDILILGGFYAAVFAVFALFEILAVNYRPVLIEGALEVSYPSSTTLLVMCVMPTAAMQLKYRIKNSFFRNSVVCAIIIFTFFMVVARLISGVHWITDIIGGAVLSVGLVTVYYAAVRIEKERETKNHR